MTHTKTIDKATLEILAACSVEAAGIRINSGQLDRKAYARLNDILTLMGGKWNRTKKVHVFNEDPMELLDQVVETGEIIDKVKQFQFYETPADVASRIVELAELDKYTDVLEPSAGKGAILEQLDGEDFLRVFTCELDPTKCQYLEKNFPSAISNRGDFLETNLDFGGLQSGCRFGAIVMNPPFSNRQDIKHINHALTMLAPGGRLVAICSAGPGRVERFQAAQNWNVFTIPTPMYVNANFHTDHWEDLPADTFKASGANVRTHLMRIRRTS